MMESDQMDFTEKTIASSEIYNGNILKLRVDEVELPNGRESTREVVEHSGGVCIIPVCGDEILLVEQYRKPAEEVLLELPAGKLDPGEDPLACARRELIEETGYQAGEISYLFSFYTSPGYSDEVLHLYLAGELKEVGSNPDQDEILRLVRLKAGEVLNLVRSGKIKDSKTIIGLFSYLRGDLG